MAALTPAAAPSAERLQAPLARLLRRAVARTQVVVISHAAPLIKALAGGDDVRHIELTKRTGETVVAEADRAAWTWPKR